MCALDFERTHFANQIGHSSHLRWSRSDSCYPPFGLGSEYLVVIFIERACTVTTTAEEDIVRYVNKENFVCCASAIGCTTERGTDH